MTRVTMTNITEVWWTHVPTATAYRIEVWCRDGQNDTMLFEDVSVASLLPPTVGGLPQGYPWPFLSGNLALLVRLSALP